MTHETEKGFGTGLRRQLERKQGAAYEVVEMPTERIEEPEPEQRFDVLQLVEPDPELEAEPTPANVPELAMLQAELEDALAREQELREALQHHVEAYERELAADRDVAMREAEAERRAARLEERETELREELERTERERAEVARLREEVVAEEARIAELAKHMDARTEELASADGERAQAAAHVAQELAALAERERELKRERAALEEYRRESEKRVAAREEALKDLDGRLLGRERALAEREAAAQAAAAEQARERGRLQERVEAVATKGVSLAKQYDARERMLVNGEAALAAWEKRLREQSERLERERAGHGQASQEAFSLLAELEQREQSVRDREAKLVQAETKLAERMRAQEKQQGERSLAFEAQLADRLAKFEEEQAQLRVKEAGLAADHELREDKLDEREAALIERERLLAEREKDLTAYVSRLQGSINDRVVA
jgi:hypothetical protein